MKWSPSCATSSCSGFAPVPEDPQTAVWWSPKVIRWFYFFLEIRENLNWNWSRTYQDIEYEDESEGPEEAKDEYVEGEGGLQ